MPVAFLTAEQRSRYGCYIGEPSPEQLALYFHLDDRDRALLDPRRHDHTRLGFALQLCTVRFLGTFLSDPTDVPHIVVLTLAAQLNIADPTVLSRYLEGQMRYDHVHEIMQVYGYQDFASQPAHFRFLRWLYTRAWWSEERLTVLFDLAMAHLIDPKVLLPGVSVLERAVASVREHATARLWQRLARIPTPPQVALLETLLVVPEGERQTPLDRLRRAPTRVSGPALVQALHRVDAVRLFEMEHLDLSFVPKGRVKALARYATTAFVHNLRQLGQDHRIATLLAFAHTYLAVVHDDALDLFDVLMRMASSQATREGQQARLRTIHDLDAAAQVLSETCQVVLDETQDPVTLRERIYTRVPAERLQAAVATVGELTRPPDDTYAQELLGRYVMLRRFLPTFWRTLEFESTPSGRPTLHAVQFLQRMEERPRASLQAAPRAVIPRSWQRYVLPRGTSAEDGQRAARVDRQAYTVCVVERLHEALRRHDIYVEPSERWGDARAKLLQPEQWEGIQAQICQTLGRETSAERALEQLRQQVEETYQRVAAHFAWEPLRPQAIEDAGQRLTADAEYIHKLLSTRWKGNLAGIAYATTHLFDGATMAMALFHPVFITTDSLYYQEVEAAVGLDTAWAQYHRLLSGTSTSAEEGSSVEARGKLAMRLYRETAHVLWPTLDEQRRALVEQVLSLIEQAC